MAHAQGALATVADSPSLAVQPAQATIPLSDRAWITIAVRVAPNSRQDFRFHGDLGDFALDHALPEDSDVITRTRTFTVAPGVYQLQAELPFSWHLAQIVCIPSVLGRIDLNSAKVRLEVTPNAAVTCTFTNQREVIIRTRSYYDQNGTHSRNVGESLQAGWPITVYREQNLVVASQATNLYGKANFNFLPPGDYTICQEHSSAWRNTQPGSIDAAFGAPCYMVALLPGEMTTLWFGNQQLDDPLSDAPTTPREIEVVQTPDVATDESGYEDAPFVDEDMLQPYRDSMLYLPVIAQAEK